jgi:large subunit ribosomal protein L35|uniref:Large ribosomal subunit protein bL35c n=2 Tax=Heterosigma akashiwo TaxID=2829 RepID=B2XT61_HETAK|nr:50S ribosomal protein L35 [Heterosigma akashiwo]ABV65959.1 50S ribosomal protein L35 [Heterosigma akashiwo]ABV70100.1 50S ribosomal protein L35 [Heterosigma akashiwo]
MPKLKTRRAALKRYKKTANQKFLRRKAFKSHILTKKSANRKRKLSKTAIVSNADIKNIKKMLLI